MAQAAQQGILGQRGTIQQGFRRLQSAAEQMPLINQVMGKIRLRRGRDAIIVGSLIGILSLLLLWLLFRH